MRIIIGNIWWLIFIISSISPESLPVRKRSFNPTRPCAQVEVTFNKKKLYVGEPLVATIRFLYDKQTYKVQSLRPPICYGGQLRSVDLIAQRDEPVTGEDGTQKIGGVCEWQAVVYATQPGKLIVEPFQVIAETVQRGKSFFGFSLTTTNNFVSQSHIFEVLALPPSPQPGACPVGKIDYTALACDKQTLCAGQGCTLTYRVQGLSNASFLPHPTLHLPDGLKAYPSTVQSSGTVVTFEYALQAVEQGRYVIDPQELLFFDTDIQQYRSLKTQLLQLYVMPGAARAPTAAVAQPMIEEPILQEKEEDDDTPVISTLRRSEVPPLVFWALVMVIVLGACARWWGVRVMYWMRKFKMYLRMRIVLMRMQKLCDSAQSPQDVMVLYERFKDLHHMINFDKTMGPQKEQWLAFCKQLEIVRFDNQREFIEMGELMKQTREWISYFKKCLKTKKLCID